MHLAVAISLICLAAANNNKKTVPTELRAKMAKSATFADLAGAMHIVFIPNNTRQRAQSDSSTTGGLRISAASFGAAPSAGGHQAAAAMTAAHHEMSDHMELIRNIRQGSDTCQLQAVCLPVENTNNDPSVVTYPICYEVMQCVGTCCNSGNNCHPHSTRQVQRAVVELGYIGTGKFKLNRTFNITMEEHTSCSCYECPDKTEECPAGLAIGPSCTCECQNQSDKADCAGGNQRWDEDSCSCRCLEEVICAAGQVLNERSCSCVSEGAIEIALSTAVPIAADSAKDIANLPKLTSTHNSGSSNSHHKHRNHHHGHGHN